MKPTAVDFETFGIQGRPDYPPLPAGAAIKYWDQPAKYYAFGHATGNNCSWAEAEAALAEAWASGPLLFHNGKFDVDVAETHFGMPRLDWSHYHDTMFLLFLDDPHQNLGLKPSAERLLGLPPEEQDLVKNWIIEHEKVKTSSFGEYSPFASGDIVGDYAIGDVDRTAKIFEVVYPKIQAREMLQAYDRERQLMPILLDMERRGVSVDLKRLEQDVLMYSSIMDQLTVWIVQKLGLKELNVDSGQQLMRALISAGLVTEAEVPVTDAGQLKSDGDTLETLIKDAQLLHSLHYRAQLKTCLGTFMRPWLLIARRSGGLIYTTWNQTRSDAGGTRTGRLSSTPNFQNIPQSFKPLFDGIDPPFELPPLPKVRGYLIPFPGHVLCGRDFSSQELRVLAHFEGGPMQYGYVDNPRLDLHQYAADLITKITHVKISRKDAKTIAFSILYGSGLGKLAEGLGCTVDAARRLREAYLGTFPGVKRIMDDLKVRAKQKIPIRTVGGRQYYCEEPKVVKGRMAHFDYKLLNYLIQGSSADLTKDAMIRFSAVAGDALVLASVHDEILISAPVATSQAAMARLEAVMNASELDVPMLSDGEMGFTWATMEDC